MAKIYVDIPDELNKKMRLICIEKEMSIKEFVSESIKEKVENGKGKK